MSNQNTKNKIIEVFRRLTVESSLAKVKVADIIAQADISRMTFYRHYLDKYHLLEEVCFQDFNHFVKIYGKNAQWRDVVMSILNVIRNNGLFYQRVLEDPEGRRRFFAAQRSISKLYTGQAADWAMNVAWEGTLNNWAKGGFRETPEEIYQILVYNLPMREVLSGQELNQAIHYYESKTMNQFKAPEEK